MTGAAVLLDRLEFVKQTGSSRWIARCPSHPDRTPSLAIRELPDGRLLLHDFAGCGTDQILATLGLEMADLFRERIGYAAQTRSRIPARDLLDVIAAETMVVAVIASTMLESRALDNGDWQRLVTALHRIGRARDHAYGR